MHILLLSQYYAPEIGAAQTRLRATAAALTRHGHQVTILTAMPNHLQDSVMPGYRGKAWVEEEIDGLRVLRTWVYAATGRNWKRLANYFSFVASSALAAARVPPIDMVFFESPPLFLGLSAVTLARKNRAKLVMNISDLWPDSVKAIAPDSAFSRGPLYWAAERLEAWLYRRADLITAVTPGIHEALIQDKGIAADRVVLLPNGVDPEIFAPRPFAEAQSDPKVFLTIGSHGYAHGLDVILDAAEVLRQRKDIRFRFVGDGSTKAELVAKAKAMGLDNVEFAPPVPLEKVPDELGRCWASLVTLRDDPFYDRTRPARTLPSLSCGRPILFSGRGDVDELIQEAGCGLVSPPSDGAALAASVATYADDPKLTAAHGQAGARYAHDHWTWDALMKPWLERIA